MACVPLALVLVACGPGGATVPAGAPPGAATSATPLPTPTPTPVGGPDAVRADGLPVSVGGATVLHALAAPGVAALTTTVDGEETVLTVTPTDAGDPVAVLLAAPAGASLDVQDDTSLVVLGGDGTFLGGAGRPEAAPDAPGARVQAGADGVARLSGVTGAVTLRVGGRAVAGTDWGEREGGRSLAVEPTPWARSAGLAGEVGVWTELVAAVPEAAGPGMRNQLACHVLGAPDKPTWNLEPWRPDVGLFAVLAAGCNPE